MTRPNPMPKAPPADFGIPEKENHVEPNRLVALVGVAAAVVTGVLIPVLDVVENDTAQAIIIGTLVLAVAAIIWKWLEGWQKYEDRNLIVSDLEAAAPIVSKDTP
jgi:high-affinity Fe2+/Pb2+ permease